MQKRKTGTTGPKKKSKGEKPTLKAVVEKLDAIEKRLQDMQPMPIWYWPGYQPTYPSWQWTPPVSPGVPTYPWGTC